MFNNYYLHFVLAAVFLLTICIPKAELQANDNFDASKEITGEGWIQILNEAINFQQKLGNKIEDIQVLLLNDTSEKERNKRLQHLINEFNKAYTVVNRKHAVSAIYMKTLLKNPKLFNKLRPDMDRQLVKSKLESLYRLLTAQLSDLDAEESHLIYNRTKYYFDNVDNFTLGQQENQYEKILVKTLYITYPVVRKTKVYEEKEDPYYGRLYGYSKLLLMIDQLPELDKGINYGDLFTFYLRLYYQSYAELVS